MNKATGIQQLTPVETGSLNQRVYAQLREALMAGKFRPAETLTLRSLAAALGTSIMPMRDAVLRLTVERAIESSRRGVRIPTMTLAEFKDLLHIRISLEGDAAAFAAERATEADIARMEEAAARTEKAKVTASVETFLAANQDFHFSVYRAARSDLLQALIETLWLQTGPYLALIADTGSFTADAVDLKAHDHLIAAIRKGDPVAARAAIAMDLQDATDVYRPFVFGAKPAEPAPRRRAG